MTDRAPAAPSTSGDSVPDAGATRYRCAACGNLTRFDVVTTLRTKAFHHYSVGGSLSIEEVEVLDESVDDVSCRWCGNGKSIEVIEDGTPAAG
jgi:hypothetical protein